MSTANLQILITAQDLASGALRQLHSVVGNLGDTVQSTVSKGFDTLKTSVNAASIAAGAAGAIFAKTGFDSAVAFEKQLSSIKALTGATDDQIKSIQKLSFQLGSDTKYSALEAAQGFEELLKAGVSLEQAMNGGIQGALDLAAAGEIEVADAAEIASTALNAFRKDNLTVSRAADILAGAANSSATSIGELKFSLAMVSAVAAGVGLTFQDTNTALAAFAQNGLKGSDAGTSLKTMLLNLQPSTDKAASYFDQLGITVGGANNKFFDAKGKIKSMAEIAGVLKTALSGLTDQQRQFTLEQMFGTDAIRAANILYEEGTEGIEAMAKAMDSVKAADVAKERTNNFAGSMERLKGTIETLQIQLIQPFLKPLADGLDRVNEKLGKFDIEGAINKIAGAIENAKTNIKAFYREVAKPIIDWFVQLWNSSDIAKGALVGIAIAIGLLLAPFQTVIVAIGLLITNWELVKSTAIKVFNIAKEKVNEFVKKVEEIGPKVQEFIIDKFNQLVTFIQNNFKPEIETLKNIWDALVITFQNLIPPILGIVGILVFLGANVIQGVIFAFQVLWPVVLNIINAIVNLWAALQPLIGLILWIANVVLGVFVVALQFVWSILVRFFEGIGTLIAGVINVFSGLINFITGIFTGNWQLVWKGIQQIFTGIFQAIVGVVASIISVFSGIISGIMNLIGSVNLIRMGWDLVQGLARGIQSAAGTVWDAFRSMANGIGGAVGDGIRGAINWVIDRINDALGGLNGLIKTARSLPGMGWLPEIGRIPRLETGGHVLSGGWAMVGERGPELVNLPGGSTVYNNSETQKAMNQSSGSQPTLVINLSMGMYTGTQRDNREIVRNLAEAITDVFPQLKVNNN